MSDEVWDRAVSWALDNPASSKEVLERGSSAWFAEDFGEADRISSHLTRNRFPSIKDAVIATRNRLWLSTVRELVRSASEPTLVLVGAPTSEARVACCPKLMPAD